MSTNSYARAATLAALILFSSATLLAQTVAATSATSAASKTEEHLRVLRMHMEAFNAADAEALKKFAAEHLSAEGRHGQTPERVAEAELGFRQMTGAFDLYEVERNNDAEFVASLEGRDQLRVVVALDLV